MIAGPQLHRFGIPLWMFDPCRVFLISDFRVHRNCLIFSDAFASEVAHLPRSTACKKGAGVDPRGGVIIDTVCVCVHVCECVSVWGCVCVSVCVYVCACYRKHVSLQGISLLDMAHNLPRVECLSSSHVRPCKSLKSRRHARDYAGGRR